MNRDEYLVREVMGWTRSKTFGDEWKWFAPDGWAEYALDEWNPGKSWPQTGMILEAMEEDFRIEIYRNTRQDVGVAYRVVFINWNRDVYGDSEGNDDLREAIATAAARARGWEDGNKS